MAKKIMGGSALALAVVGFIIFCIEKSMQALPATIIFAIVGAILLFSKGKTKEKKVQAKAEKTASSTSFELGGAGMANYCPLCGKKLGGFMIPKFMAADGEICGSCTNFCPAYQATSIQELTRIKAINEERARNFCKTSTLKSILSECVLIDNTHRWFGQVKNEKSQPYFIYSFDEVIGYEFQEVGGKVVTKSKGGLGRAVVGGALFGGVGAVVGAATSQTETKKVGAINLLRVYVETAGGKKCLTFSSPPNGFTAFLDRCISDGSDASSNMGSLSAADEIKKYKALFDEGILTQDEFEAKKQQLLGL